MPTPCLDRPKLNALIGEATVTRAEADNQLDINAVIEASCALVDSFAAAQVALPPSLTAQAQVAPLVAELVYCALMDGYLRLGKSHRAPDGGYAPAARYLDETPRDVAAR